MDSIQQLTMLAEHMNLEYAEDTQCVPPRPTGPSCDRSPGFVSYAVLPNGQRAPLLKTLQTSACERNCFYCPFRAGRDFRRATFQPDELAKTYISIERAGIVKGIFLSSGIAGGGVRTQDQLIATTEILRRKYQYKGYIHLKVMPGAEHAQVERAMQLADRVSVNLEAPNNERLQLLAPRKTFLEELLQPLRWIEEIRQNYSPHRAYHGHWPSSTTQFVVGASGDTDLELLQTTAYLYAKLHLRRAYFSAFHPIPDTPLEELPAESPQRELRLYQASFLLRDYEFQFEELPFSSSGSLPLHIDPKTAWAEINLSDFPVEINLASRQELLRIPGIGPKSVKAILEARSRGRLRDVEDLRKIGVNPDRAAPYILMEGHRPVKQLRFW